MQIEERNRQREARAYDQAGVELQGRAKLDHCRVVTVVLKVVMAPGQVQLGSISNGVVLLRLLPRVVLGPTGTPQAKSCCRQHYQNGPPSEPRSDRESNAHRL